MAIDSQQELVHGHVRIRQGLNNDLIVYSPASAPRNKLTFQNWDVASHHSTDGDAWCYVAATEIC